jgi:hypothetical protein
MLDMIDVQAEKESKAIHWLKSTYKVERIRQSVKRSRFYSGNIDYDGLWKMLLKQIK